jgi:protein tyrosine phosphatase (PTP) superfamily phosphohydrolase (DUF442 family)
MDQIALEQIRNFYTLDDNVATGGQPEADQFAAISQAGFDVVINLALADSPGAVSAEDKIIHDLGMVYEHIPVNFNNPAPDDLDLFFHSMQRHRGKRIFVHCAYNWRVSSFMFLYRTIKCGCPVDEALHDLHAVWQPDNVWQNFIESALDSYNRKY